MGGTIYCSPSEHALLCEQLALKIKQSNVQFDILIALSRGGLIPGVYLSHALNKRLVVITASSYEDRNQNENVTLGELPSIQWDNLRTLIVDDLVDSGKTLECVKSKLSALGAKVHTAVLYDKKTGLSDYSVTDADPSLWIKFWYERG